MLAALGHGTLRVGGTAQEQMCYFDQPLGRGCSFRSRIRTRHYALIKTSCSTSRRATDTGRSRSVPLADGNASIRKTVLKGINPGFTGTRFPGR